MSRTVFITGSGRRIGRALAVGFARRGWQVAVHYCASEERAKRTLAEVRSHGVRAELFRADVRERAEIRTALGDADRTFGGIDVLVNNAGVYPPRTSLADIDEEQWRSVIETNLYGEFFAAQAAAELMIARRGDREEAGRIVNISSLGAVQIWRDRIPYNVSKAAVVQLTRALARSLAPYILVNSVAPGAIEIPDDSAPGAMIAPAKIPLRRHGTGDDILSAVWFFAVEASYVTGQTLVVDGGLSIAQETSQE